MTDQPGYGPNPTAQGVRGCRDLPADDVALINAVKELQENVANVWAVIYLRPGTDRRWANVAKVHLEEGVSALVRSVAQPHDPFRAALSRLIQEADGGRPESVEDADFGEPATPPLSTEVFPDGAPEESTEDNGGAE